MAILQENNLFIGNYARVGIRPAIDGRRQGVRESLEGTTMALAKVVAELLARNLRHRDGSPVECVIPDTCIGGVAEAAKTAALFSRQGVGLSIIVTPCWCYGSETMDMDPLIPKAVWGFNGTERPGAVCLAATLAAHNQEGLPAFSIYGHDVQDAGDTEVRAECHNSSSLTLFFYKVMRLLMKYLNRRSQRGSYNWAGFSQLIEQFGIVIPYITRRPKHYNGMRATPVIE
jgi:hypothetical protein